MNDFLQLAASRQSDRAYDMSRAVEPEKLERIFGSCPAVAFGMQCTAVAFCGDHRSGTCCKSG